MSDIIMIFRLIGIRIMKYGFKCLVEFKYVLVGTSKNVVIFF